MEKSTAFQKAQNTAKQRWAQYQKFHGCELNWTEMSYGYSTNEI